MAKTFKNKKVKILSKVDYQKEKQWLILKYNKIVADAYKRLQDKTMEEFWQEMDKIKDKMGVELDEIKRHYIHKKNEGRAK